MSLKIRLKWLRHTETYLMPKWILRSKLWQPSWEQVFFYKKGFPLQSWRKQFSSKDFMSKPCCLCTKRFIQTGTDMRTWEFQWRCYDFCPEKQISIIILQIPSEWSEREKKINNNILCLFLQKVGLIVKFTNRLVSNQYFLQLLNIFYGFKR